MTHRTRTTIVSTILCAAIVSAIGATSRTLVVEPARTRVGVARVVLNLDPLTLSDETLVGDYTLRVPLAPSMDDAGKVEIPLTTPLGATVEPGNTVHGTATSREDGRIHEVACTFTKRNKVRIVVTTPNRVLSFEAPYTLQN